MKSLFLLDPSVIFLNHGSFGATPRPVFAAYQEWQRRLEWQPVQFLANELPRHLAEARQALGAYLGAAADDLVYVPNATFALNVVARSLPLGAGDEVLTSDHEYGACDNVWRFLSQKQGFTYVTQHIPLGLTAVQMADALWQGVTPRTRVIFLSHITSATALRLPVELICQRAHAVGILTVIDGAHAPGQIPLHLAQIGADFYFGNAHKWLMSAKGAAFLYARAEVQPLIEPLVVSWGWGTPRALTFGSDFLDYLQWLGTDDFSAYLSVPAALAFQQAYDWEAVRARCHALLRQTLPRLSAITGLPAPYVDDDLYRQMAVVPLPQMDGAALKQRLYESYRIEIPVTVWQQRPFLRLSLQGYNSEEDVAALLAALAELVVGR